MSSRTSAAVSVFGDYMPDVYSRTFHGVLRVHSLVGGIPTDKNKAEGWIRSKLGESRDDQIKALAAETMVERGVTIDEALEDVVAHEHLNGFKRNEDGLYVEGRQLKSCLKEAANIRWPKDRWGVSRKGTRSYFAEHIFVIEDVLPITGPGVVWDEALKAWGPTRINQRFVHTWRGNGIQYEEIVDDAEIHFTVATDADPKDITDENWAHLWVTAQMNGFGASRSQGFGRFDVIKWEKESAAKRKSKKAKNGGDPDEEGGDEDD